MTSTTGRAGYPFQSLPPRAFWRTAVAEPEVTAIDGL
jgi:hypothetical protein